MASNQGVDLNTLVRGLNQAKLIPYGGAAEQGKLGGFLNALGYMGDFMKAVNATPQGQPGIIAGLGALADRYNVRSYNKAMANQLAAEQLRQQQAQNRKRADRIGLGKKLGLPEGYTGEEDIPDATTLSNLQNMNWQNSPDGLSTLLKDGSVGTVQGGAVPQYVVEGALKQSQDVNKSQQMMKNMAVFLANNLAKPQGMGVSPDGVITDDTGSLDLSDQPKAQTLKAGLANMIPPPGMVAPGQAYQYPVIDYAEGFDLRKNEQDNANTQFSNNTTRTHYTNQDRVADAELKLKDEGNYFVNYPPSPSGGGGRSPFTDLNGAQQYMNSQLGAVEAQMKAEGFLDEKGKLKAPGIVKPHHYELPGGLGGVQWGKNAGNAAQVERFNQLNSQRQALLGNIGGLTFGGSSGQKMKQAGAAADAATAYQRFKKGQ